MKVHDKILSKTEHHICLGGINSEPETFEILEELFFITSDDGFGPEQPENLTNGKVFITTGRSSGLRLDDLREFSPASTYEEND